MLISKKKKTPQKIEIPKRSNSKKKIHRKTFQSIDMKLDP